MVNSRSPSSLLSRVVTVNRSLTPQQALDATGCCQELNDANVVATMPRGQSVKKTVFFLKIQRYMVDEEVDRELAIYGLVRTDPYALAKVNQDNPSFAATYPNGTHWRDAQGRWCVAQFDWWSGERYVRVSSSNHWPNTWWVAGELGEQC